ncbi:hypothetical protein CKO12_13485 [Chromatium okenii]|uniref:restriction endonuclease subunit S n=1 Tax=Chromatium okenii TaxID=61644 RepID=UPI0019057084|nr:restriction endonuclease subunit S [Chromatium okenii]MBK1642862.1 hypothetical protein [Chromatium okenii]
MKAGWNLKRLGDLTALVTKGTTPTSIGHSFTKEGINFIKIESISSTGQFIEEKFAHVSADCHTVLKRSQLQSGDILFSIAGALGRTAFVTDDILPANTNQALSIIRLKHDPNLSPEFVRKALETGFVLEQVEKVKGGVAQQNLSLAQVNNFNIPIPPIHEQRRIVTILDQAFAGIATAKANAEQNLKNARALFESHLQSVFTERGEGWAVTTLDKISTNLDSERIPITKSVRDSGEYPYYGASGIVDYVADYIFDCDALLISEDGANLLARSTPIAFSVSGKYWVNNHAHILKFGDMATQRFVEFYLASIRLDEYITGAAQPKLNQKAMNSIPIPIPTAVDERAEIIGQIELLQNETQHLESIYQRKLAALDDLKKSLLNQAFSGQL